MSSEPEDATIKPCPFCGSAAAIADNQLLNAVPDTWFVKCLKCEAQGPAFHDGSEGWGHGGLPSLNWRPGDTPEAECRIDAILGWNKRGE